MFAFGYFSVLILQFCFGFLHGAAPNPDRFFMDKMCGTEAMVLDGDFKPGTFFKLTSATKYLPNFNCTAKFRAIQASQRLVITVENMDITDCPGDVLRIYDGTNLLNKDIKQQCGKTSSSFSFTTTTNQATFTFTSNSAIESSGFQIAIAIHFPAVANCPQSLGLFLCANKNCIAKKLQCDAHNHCGDSTDEMSCSLIGK